MNRTLRADVLAGLTTAAVVIPKSMAFAAVAGLPLEVGLYTSLIPLIVYAATGTSRALSVTTTSTIAILAADALAKAAPGADAAHLEIAASSLTLMVGGVLLVAAALRLGFLANFISAPVLVGFKAGIALVIIVDQLPKLLGIHIAKGNFLQSLARIAGHLPDTTPMTLALAVGLLVLIAVLARFLPKWPAPLVAVGVAIAVSAFIGLERFGVELVGRIRPGLPSLDLPDVTLLAALWQPALGIVLISFVETVAAGRAFVRPGEPLPTSNRELLALGFSNIAGSAFHNMPSGGGTSQTAVNVAAGARSQAAGLATAGAVLATLLLLAPVVALMPLTALAAVVVATTAGLFRPADFAAIWHVRQREFWWAVTATAGVVLLGTLDGILVSVAISVLVLFYQANRPPVYLLGRRRGTDSFERLTDERPDIETFPGLLMLRTEGRIHFANAHRIGEQIWPLVHAARPQIVALEMSAVPDLEYTALQGLIDAQTKLRDAGTTLWLVALNPQVREVIERSKLGDAIGADCIVASLGQVVDAHARAAETIR